MSQTPPSAAAHRQAAMTTRAAMAAWADAAASAGRDDLDGHAGRDDSDGRDVTRDGLADARFGLRCLRRDGVDGSAGADGDHGRHGAAGPAGRDGGVSGADGDRGRHGDDDPTRSWGRNGAVGSTLESSLTLRDWGANDVPCSGPGFAIVAKSRWTTMKISLSAAIVFDVCVGFVPRVVSAMRSLFATISAHVYVESGL